MEGSRLNRRYQREKARIEELCRAYYLRVEFVNEEMYVISQIHKEHGFNTIISFSLWYHLMCGRMCLCLCGLL